MRKILSKNSDIFKMLTNTNYYNSLRRLALARFKWNNLPNNISARFLEKVLNDEGKICFFSHPDIGLVVAKCVPVELNYQDEPNYYTCNFNGVLPSINVDPKECVIIRNTLYEESTDEIILNYATQLTETDEIRRINLNAQKTPVMVETDDDTYFSLQKLIKSYDGNLPFIFKNKNLASKPLSVLKTDAPYLVDKLRDETNNIWNECLTLLGINNNPVEKRERLVTSEVEANNELINTYLNVYYQPRLEAVEQINKIFNTNISIELNTGNSLNEKESVIDG